MTSGLETYQSRYTIINLALAQRPLAQAKAAAIIALIMRRLLCILLMICFPLQGMAMHWNKPVQSGNMSYSHAVLHEEHVNHHHEGDGSIHIDSSDESVKHVQDHCCSPQPCGLFVARLAPAPIELVESITASVVTFIPDPMLELPHRPPAPALG